MNNSIYEKKQKFIDKAKQKHQGKYQYDCVEYVNYDTKVIVHCPDHGNFLVRPRCHIYKNTGCNSCAVHNSKLVNTKTTEQFIKQSEYIHNNKYDYSKVCYINANTYVTIICPIHGPFQQRPTIHTSKKAGCPQCGAGRLTQDDFIEKANIIHEHKYSYEDVNYQTGKRKVRITCPIHGHFMQSGESHLCGSGCPQCGLDKCSNTFISKGENEVAEFIESFGIKIERNKSSYIYPLQLDIVIPKLKLAIEYNGIYWHSEKMGKNKTYHLLKTQQCKDNGINLIHIFEHEWKLKQNIVKSRIRARIGHTHRIYARQCKVVNISKQQSKQFLQSTHLQGSVHSSVQLGLIYNDELISVMTFGCPRFNTHYQWELLRFSSSLDYTIVGGASKLFVYFVKKYDPDHILSYSDKRWGDGNVYRNLGFELSHIAEPNYYYFQQNNTLDVKHRVNFQKHKLKKQLPVFNPKLTEWENMSNNGYNRFWDCGNDVFVWTKGL